MKRPLALIGLTTMLVLTVCFYADLVWINLLVGLSLVGLAVSLSISRLRTKPEFPAFFAVILVAVTGFTMFSEFYVKPVQAEFCGETAEVTATLLDEPEYYKGKQFCTLKTKTINGKNKNIRMMLRTKSEFRCEVGDTIEFTAELEKADYGKNLADKIYINAYTYEDVNVTEAEQRPFYYYIVKLRQNIRGPLYMKLEKENADLASATLLGDSNFSDETYEALRRTGLTHIVVVSGLHLTIITTLYAKSIGKILKNKYINALLTALIVFFFLCLTGFGRSSIRAAVMLFVLVASKLFKREGDSLNFLGLSAILLCFNPFIVGDVGVLLSFSATFGIVVFGGPLCSFMTKGLNPVHKSKYPLINKSWRFMVELFSVTVAAVFCTLPVTVLCFGKVSLVQIFANLFVSPLVQWFMLSSALCAVFVFLPVVSEVFAFVADFIGKAMFYVINLFSSFPMAYVKADYDFVIFWIIAVILIFVTAYFIRRNGKGLHIICVLMSVIVFASGSLGHIISSQNKLTVYVTPAKEGQSIILSSKDGNVLINTSDNDYTLNVTEDILEDIYTEKQLMITTTPAEDNLSALFDYKEVLMYDKISETDCKILLWNKAKLIVFERNSQVYMYLTCSDTSVLILPDFGSAEDIPKEMRTADVLITSGIIDNMELLSFKTLISNGNEFRKWAVVDYFSNRSINAVSVSDTVNFDIVG